MVHRLSHTSLILWRCFAALTLASVAADLARAQTLEEVVVTARRVEESLQETPVAVSALTSADLEQRNIVQLKDVQNAAPNLTFFPSGIMGESAGQVYIRGVGQFDYFVTADPGVGVYVDGVYLGRSLGNILDVLDVERIEVLRGPQGTLYGKNTVGGAINVITRKPEDKIAGYVELKTGRYSRADARGAASVPLIAGVLDAKLAFSTRNADGFGRRPRAGDTMGDQHTTVGQFQLNWTPREGLHGLLAFDYTRTDQKLGVHHVELYTGSGLAGLQNALAGPLGALHPGVVVQPLDNTWYSTDPYVDNGTGSNFLKTDVWGVSQTFDWTIGTTVLKSITAYRRLHEQIGIDPDGSPVVMIDEIDNDHQAQLSQELQLSGASFRDRLKWVSGLYYMNEKSSSDVMELVASDLFPALEALPAAIVPLGPYPCPQPPGSPAPCLGGAGNPFNVIFDLPQHNYLNQLTESYAAYAQGSYKLTDALSLTLGGRYTSDHKHFAVDSLRLRTPVPLLPYSTQSGSWAKFSGRAGLDYRITDTVLAYVSASQGFKSGGFNGRARNVGELEGYGPETLLSYELGLKSEWFDRRLRANVAAFANKYKDIQLTEQHLSAEGTQTIVTHNAGDADIKGLELELDAVPVKGLRLNASVGYLDAKYVRISAAAAATGLTLEDKLIGTPRWTVSAGAEYGVPIGEYGQLTLRGDASYRALTYFQLINEPTTSQPGYSLFNARLGFDSSDGHWTVATGVTNLANKVYRVSGVNVGDSLGFTAGWYGRPREWFLQGGYHF